MSELSNMLRSLYFDSYADTVDFYGSEYQCISCGDLLDNKGRLCGTCSRSPEVREMLRNGHGVQEFSERKAS